VPACTAALVLSGGGARGAYQVGVLREIARQYPDVSFPIITGVSAGAINAAYIASHREPLVEVAEGLAHHWSQLSASDVMRTGALPLLANVLRAAATMASGGSRMAPPTRGLVDTRPLRDFLDRVIEPEIISSNIRAGRLQALAVSATSYRSGDSVTFVQGPPETEMWQRWRRESRLEPIGVDHVLASAAIPLFFPACRVDGEYFGDGGLRQPYPLSPAVHLGADRILAVSSRTASVQHADDRTTATYPSTARVLGLMLNTIFLDHLDADAERLERVNGLLQRLDPKQRWLVPQREVELLVVRPSRDIGRMAASYERKLPWALRHMIRGLGTRRSSGSDLLSYLLFVPEFLADLIRLGERDAELNRNRIRHFMEGCAPTSE